LAGVLEEEAITGKKGREEEEKRGGKRRKKRIERSCRGFFFWVLYELGRKDNGGECVGPQPRSLSI
jgi:hypothetical protein